MIVYRLGAHAAARRARAAAAVTAMTGIAPVVLAAELAPRLGWASTRGFWAAAIAIAVLVATRASVQYSTMKRRLAALLVTLDDDSIATEIPGDAYAIARGRVARIVEIEGALGGMRVESEPEPPDGVVLVASVPRGGERFGDVRARLAQWGAIERRARRGPAARLLVGAAIVTSIFFLPFALDEFVARSKIFAAVLVIAAWAALRWTMRGR